MTAVLGVDVGGTFTDLVRWDGAAVTAWKELSTPDDQSVGVVQGAERVGGGNPLLHGTTVATNALLQRRGAPTALVTTAGFEDVLEIGRQDRPSLYDPFADRPAQLVPRARRFGVSDAARWTPPPELSGAQSVAVSLLYGHLRPDDEAAVAATVGRALPGVPVSMSSRVVAEFREYERTATTVLNAYLAPETGRYLERLTARIVASGLSDSVLVMRSSGGLLPATEAAALPAAVVLSGPAGGVVAAASLATTLGLRRVVSFDMGGTSTDVCRIEAGRPQLTYERAPGGHPCRMPSVAIHTVGAGGGSIAWRDEGGSLRVGPHSAGADPGPACYGRPGGVEATVTDANVVAGRIDPAGTLAETLRLRPDLATAALGRLGAVLGLDVTGTALGILTVVEEVMAAAVRTVSVQEGADPAEAHLVAFGGAGGLHATSLARRLGMAGVVVPGHAGVFSALGLLLSPPRIDLARSRLRTAADAAALAADVAGVRAAAADRFTASGAGTPGSVDVRVDVRYVGQSHELSIPWPASGSWEDLVAAFHETHRRRNGFARPGDAVEAVTVRAEAVGAPVLTLADLPAIRPRGEAVVGTRPVVTADGPVEATVVRREGLAPDREVVGPAVIEEAGATTWLGAGERARVHESGAIEVTW